tara:strand:- start:1674 stop:2495 length:822 start_codon:yes stop_codon:yes gene_type:complete
MKTLIESQDPISAAIHNALVQAGIRSFLWNNSHSSLMDAYDECKPDLIIINRNCNALQCQTLASLENIKFVFVGEWDKSFPIPSLCLSKNSYKEFPSIPHTQPVFDPSSVIKGLFNPKVSCEISVFTDGMTEDFLNKNIEVINLLIEKKARFFGGSTIPVPNYLGGVTPNIRSQIIASSDVCVDIMGSLWRNIALAGGVVVSSKSPVDTFLFTDSESLEKKIDEFLTSRPNTQNLKMIAMEESSINICIDMFRFFQAQPIVSHFIQMKQRFLQ